MAAAACVLGVPQDGASQPLQPWLERPHPLQLIRILENRNVVQAAYLLELDRQEKRDLAPNWWKPFKYKLVCPLIDSRDGSIYGALVEWDQLAALVDLIVIEPQGAPKAVLALRGTLLKQQTVVDLRFFACESLRGSARFTGALEVLKSAIDKHGTNNVCIAGHSLGAGFALQVGRALAMDGTFAECHLFNPPSVSLGMGLRNLEAIYHQWHL